MTDISIKGSCISFDQKGFFIQKIEKTNQINSITRSIKIMG